MKHSLRTGTDPFSIIATNKYIFGSFFLFVFITTFVFLYLMNLVPNELTDVDISQVQKVEGLSTTTTSGSEMGELPTRIVIDKIGVNSVILNTEATDIKTLNDLLLKGVVRYADSGYVGKGNLFLFGHSTSIKVVNNQAYKAFNNLKDLKAGDLITVYAGEKKSLYKVTKVSLVNSQDTVINLSTKKAMLTLSSCDTLGAKEDRYVVEANYVGIDRS